MAILRRSEEVNFFQITFISMCLIANCVQKIQYLRNLFHLDQSYATKRHAFSPVQIQMILKEHNRLRAMEPAANMQELVWDENLAFIALDWASRCTAGHRSLWQRRRISSYHVIGENIWWSNEYNIRADLGSVIRDFYREKWYYSYESNSCATNKVCGHYLQVVWGDTCAVGCAAAYCPFIHQGRGIRSGNMIVCNYGPGGNIIGYRPYKYGQPCSTCPSSCRNGLCRNKMSQFYFIYFHSSSLFSASQCRLRHKVLKEASKPWKTITENATAFQNFISVTKGKNAISAIFPLNVTVLQTTPLPKFISVRLKVDEIRCTGMCEKTKSECITWAENGLCETNRQYMDLMCSNACGISCDLILKRNLTLSEIARKASNKVKIRRTLQKNTTTTVEAQDAAANSTKESGK
ncbi:SCP-like protein [Trichinella nativa]|uniref:SCP-like protein n=1 Tax=Trichinella nativa TaxID=6335 RepID=A0A1Y3EFV7_9BILA|nr:SCP-like protein [Trichinella nativa]